MYTVLHKSIHYTQSSRDTFSDFLPLADVLISNSSLLIVIPPQYFALSTCYCIS